MKVVGLFWGRETLGEASTEMLFEALVERGCRVAFPRVDGSELDFRELRHASELKAGFRGLLEPSTQAIQVAIGSLDVIVVPGLGFGPDGQRLGRGGGFYDRLLAHPDCRATSIGWAYAFQIIDDIPMAAHDRKVKGVATECGLVLYPPAQ